MADTNDYGLKISYPGIKVQNATDTQQLYNSSWPTLSVIKNIQIIQNYAAGTSQGNENIIYSHNLGYYPAFIPYLQSTFASGSFPTYAEITRTNLRCDKNSIVFSGGFHTLAITLNLGLLIFSIDLETNYTAPNINTTIGGTISIDNNYGFKATKAGYNINDTDLRHFTAHSNTRGPLLHAVSAGIADSSGNFSYTHNLPYNPIFFGYIRQAGLYVLMNGFSGLSASGQTITLKTTAGNKCSIIVLKDPISTSDNVVNYNG